MPSIEDAIKLAMESHHGQTDKAGLPYILHPLRVMSAFVKPDDDDARYVAVLHDVVEDCEVTSSMLAGFGYSSVVVEAIDAISRRKGESYTNYIERVSRNPLALRVKLADLADNLDEARASTGLLSPNTKAKYRMAQTYLIAVRDPDETSSVQSRVVAEEESNTAQAYQPLSGR